MASERLFAYYLVLMDSSMSMDVCTLATNKLKGIRLLAAAGDLSFTGVFRARTRGSTKLQKTVGANGVL